MHNRIRLLRVLTVFVLLTAFTAPARAQLLNLTDWHTKLDPVLLQRASLLTGQSRIVLRVSDNSLLAPVLALVTALGGTVGLSLPIVTGVSATIPNAAISLLAMNALVVHISFDRGVAGAMERTGATVGATTARQELGVDGSGVGVAIIDSGAAATHDDLAATGRVVRFVDFVNHQSAAYDDYGHGTHVAGIVAGSGFDSGGARTGIAPGANLIVLKALDASGSGRISDVIAALGYAIVNKNALHIRVVNMSIAAPVSESYYADPLTLATLAAVNSGIVVVAAAGNNGRSVDGHGQYGGVAAPGNAPWVLTVGASSHMGTIDRSDDNIATFSSRGPTAVDVAAKPDLVAPGVGIESLSDPGGTLYSTMAPYLLPGTIPVSYLPYLSLSGTSMSAPVVSGTVALMLDANPSLTPNAVKAILQYTAQIYPAWDPLTEGAGFLNAQGAVELARAFAIPSSPTPSSSTWSGRLIWGNRSFQGGQLAPAANAWTPGLVWGATKTVTGQRASWGPQWNTASPSANVVWGTHCGGANCTGPWTASVIAADDGGDTVVWGTSDQDTVVWGTSDDDTVVWGTSCSDPSCQPVLWGHP
jgi:serine protease AprX